MAQFPEWIDNYFENIPRHPVDYFESPTSTEELTMSEILEKIWSYNPFKTLLSEMVVEQKPEDPNGEKQNKKPKKHKSKRKPDGAGNVVIPGRESRKSVSSGESSPRVVERVTERYESDTRDEKSRSGGDTVSPTRAEEEKGKTKGKQKPDGDGES